MVSPLLAQENYLFEAKISNLPNTKVYLFNFEGDKNLLLDSASTDLAGSFKLSLKANWQPGIYKIEIGIGSQTQRPYSFNFIFNGENIKLSTKMPDLVESMQIITSDENELYYSFNKYNTNTINQLSAIFQLKNVFTEDDSFYPVFKSRYALLLSQYQEYFDSIMIFQSNSYAFHYITANRFPVFSFSTPLTEVQTYILAHYFDYMDFIDTKLLRTDIFTSKAFSYIQMYRNQSLNKSAQEAEFNKAIDIVLTKASVNKKAQLQIIDYLVRGFEMVGMDAVLTHIANNYIKDIGCTDISAGKNLNAKLEGFTKMALGKTVPDFKMNCADKSVYSLYQSAAPYTLIIFWASWCPHCLVTLPEIKRVYDGLKNKSLEIVTISIDTSATEWRKAINDGDYLWKNCCDLKGWDGPEAINYYLSATPSIFLVDRQKKIIAKPMSAEELLLKLNELGIQ